MSLVCVFAASKMEGEPVRQIIASNASSHIGANDLVLITGGMGPKGARAKAVAALDSASPKPGAVLVIGLCGALTSSLPETRVVTYKDCLSIEPNKQPLRCSPSITNRLRELLVSRGISCDLVVAITSSRIAVTKDEKLALVEAGANVVHMARYEILAASEEAGIPQRAKRNHCLLSSSSGWKTTSFLMVVT